MIVLGFHLHKETDLHVNMDVPGALRSGCSRYIIEGFNDTWIDIVKRATVTYIGHNSGFESSSLELTLTQEMLFLKSQIEETIKKEQALIKSIDEKLRKVG